jgi:hypothetical protein
MFVTDEIGAAKSVKAQPRGCKGAAPRRRAATRLAPGMWTYYHSNLSSMIWLHKWIAYKDGIANRE